jgi:hypothetical protein
MKNFTPKILEQLVLSEDIDPEKEYLKNSFPNMRMVMVYKSGQAFGEIALITESRR